MTSWRAWQSTAAAILAGASALNDAPVVHADDRGTWRAWLEANHATIGGVWLVSWWPRSGRVGIDYGAAVEEALCFGWVDSTSRRFDDDRRGLYFAPRKPRSVWAASNKQRVERRTADERMAPAGLAAIERAKANGSWTSLDTAERLEVPDDLATVLAGRPPAAVNFAAFPPSTRKMLLGWVATAQRPQTRASRIAKVAEAASRNERVRGDAGLGGQPCDEDRDGAQGIAHAPRAQEYAAQRRW